MKITSIRFVDGIKITTIRTRKGTVTESPCQCFGDPKRVHSSLFCPWRIKRQEA